MRMDLLVGLCILFSAAVSLDYAFFMPVRAQMHVVSCVLCFVCAVFCYNLLVCRASPIAFIEQFSTAPTRHYYCIAIFASSYNYDYTVSPKKNCGRELWR